MYHALETEDLGALADLVFDVQCDDELKMLIDHEWFELKCIAN